MKINYKLVFLSLLFVAASCNTGSNERNAEEGTNAAQVKKVELKTNEKGFYRLYVDGEEFYINGAGLEFGNQEALAKHGANAFRTWRTDNGEKTGEEVLNEAQSNGLMVFMGIEVGRERHGYDYDDTEWVNKQFEDIKKQVLMYKDHPALLGWGIGNELNLHLTNNKVWNAVNDISKMIHEVDGNHPTTTMLAGIGSNEINYMKEYCADLDFISIQMYGDIVNLQQRIEDSGYDGPYMVTEWGATGHWEVGTTEWESPIEQTSTEKANSIKHRYMVAIASDSVRCIGSFVFLWGQKQERTPTWYGLFTENDEETQPIDVMHYYWNNNQWPSNRAPEISDITLNGKTANENIKVNVGEELALFYNAIDPDNDEMSWRFEVLREATDLKDGGDLESRPKAVEVLVVSEAEGKMVFNPPAESGAYRAFIYVLDGHNHAATANIPFYVN